MTITTQTYDDAVYKLVPAKPNREMKAAGAQQHDLEFLNYAEDVFVEMVANIPADLPGVVVHSGEPVGYFIKLKYPDGSYRYSYLTPNITSFQHPDSFLLYTHPAPVEVEQLQAGNMRLSGLLTIATFEREKLRQQVMTLKERENRHRSFLLDGLKQCGVSGGGPGWIEHTENGKLIRDTLSFEGEMHFGFELIASRFAELEAQPTPEAIVEWTRRACQVAVEDALNDEDDPLAAIELLDLSAIIQAAKEGR